MPTRLSSELQMVCRIRGADACRVCFFAKLSTACVSSKRYMCKMGCSCCRVELGDAPCTSAPAVDTREQPRACGVAWHQAQASCSILDELYRAQWVGVLDYTYGQLTLVYTSISNGNCCIVVLVVDRVSLCIQNLRTSHRDRCFFIYWKCSSD